MFAMLRCTKTSPGESPRIVVSGTRLSEQPIQRMEGDWPFASWGKREGFSFAVVLAHCLLEWRACVKASLEGGLGC